MLPNKVYIFVIFLSVCFAQVTKIVNNNPLVRKKRYLNFPKDTTFVMTLSMLKALLQVQPRGWNLAVECDVPWPIPSDTRKLKKKNHDLQKREILQNIEAALFDIGFDGTSCVKRIMCEVFKFKKKIKNLLVLDILSAIFFSKHSIQMEIQSQMEKLCTRNLFDKCEDSFVEYILNSLSTET